MERRPIPSSAGGRRGWIQNLPQMKRIEPCAQVVEISRNQLLAGLPPTESQRLLSHLQLLSLRQNQILFLQGETAHHVYFPVGAVISLLVSLENGGSVAVGLIGSEGLAGLGLLLGGKTATQGVVVQAPGDCLRVNLEVLREEFERRGALHDRILGYARKRLAQTSQAVACNRVHLLEQRLACWLLMVHDRVKKDEFPMTHEFLSSMLGTPRSEVTIAAGVLRKAWLIRYWRGRITILDRR